MISLTSEHGITSFRSEQNPDGSRTLFFQGRLDSEGTAVLWDKVFHNLNDDPAARVLIDASEVHYCDGSGIGLLLEIKRHQKAREHEVVIQNLAPEYENLMSLYAVSEFAGTVRKIPDASNIYQETGRATLAILKSLRDLVIFIGELCATLFQVIRRPYLLRWKDVLLIIEKAGTNALPIISLVGFLIGLILSFQSAIPMRQFGAEMFVANLVGLSLLRELGPLVTAIILAGRSGAAFAAEIGTMKVNEEINALTTMGINPVRFLVITRLIAAAIVTPVLTVFAILFGLIGGGVVYGSLGFPIITFIRQVQFSTTYVDFLGGLAKSFAFGILIASVSCLNGLLTKSGASAVGDSTTRAVVNTLVLIVITDGLFSVTYYYLGI